MWFVLAVFLSLGAKALVTTSTPLGESGERLSLRLTREGGKIKPSRDEDSWQNANNRIAALTYSRLVRGISFGSDHTFGVEYRRFTTPKEKVDGQKIYSQDEGNQVSLNWAFNFHHTVDSSFGPFFQFSPVTDFNEDKFAVTRVDLFRLGFRGGFNMGAKAFQEAFFMVGSGIPGHQNSYVALSQSVGYRMNGKIITKLGPYVEADLQERVDERYNAIFSSSPSEKTRLFKAGFIAGIDWSIDRNNSLQLDYLQKVYGQSLTSTNAVSLNWAMNL